MSNFYPVSSLIGGGSGALDAIAHTNADGFGTPLATGDIAIVGSSAFPKVYRYDSTDSTAENSPRVIEPDSGGGAWTCVSDRSATNLLPNTGFTCFTLGASTILTWPWSTSFATAGELTGWSGYAGATPTWHASGHINSTTTAQWGTITKTLSGLFTIGKLYRLSGVRLYCATAGKLANIKVITGASTTYIQSVTSIAGWVTMTNLYFVADHADVAIHLQHATDTTAFTWDDIYFGEVAIEGATATTVAPDGWLKSGALLVQRVWARDYSLPGTYAMKLTPSGAGNELLYAPKGRNSTPQWLNSVKGKTVTFGAWVVSTVSGTVRVRIYKGTAYGAVGSGYHSGSGSPEWLEVTTTIPTDCDNCYINFTCDTASTTVAYVSQPMLVFGDHIGAGNYQPVSNEIIVFEQEITLSGIAATPTVATALPYNLEETSLGLIGGGLKAALGRLYGLTGTVGRYLAAGPHGSLHQSFSLMISGVSTTYGSHAAGKIDLGHNGKFYIYCDAAYTLVAVRVQGAIMP